MRIKNLNNISTQELKSQVSQGGKFVVFEYTVSIVIMTFKRSSSVYYLPPNESAFKHSWGHTGLSALVGWWGIPWGPIYTIGSLIRNLSGGKDVTAVVMQQVLVNDHAAASASNQSRAGDYGVNNLAGTASNNDQTYNIQQ